MGANERSDLREQIGIAVNASSLVMRERAETALDRVAAMGSAAAAIASGADREDQPIAGARSVVYGTVPDKRDVIAGELVPMLWHIRYGRQHGLVPRAITLFARWLVFRKIFTEFEAPEKFGLLERFAGRLLHEWLSDRCIACGGSGKLEKTKGGSLIRPRGSMQRNATFAVCTSCQGTRMAAPNETERARWMGVTAKAYEDDGWTRRFSVGRIWLTGVLARRINRPLTAELERRTRRI